MKKFLFQIFLLLLVIGVGVYFYSPTQPTKKIDLPFLPTQPNTKNIQINDVVIAVEIADTQQKRSKGLGEKASLGEKEGMLFVFDKVDKHPFWMKGLSFPLDFVWIKDDKVIDITENVPAPTANQKDADLPIYTSKEPVNRVLELNGGSVKKFNIKVADPLKIIN
jgi:uncharacterized protein